MWLDCLLIGYIDCKEIILQDRKISWIYWFLLVYSHRRKTGSVASSFPNYLSFGRHCNCIDPCWRRDYEALLPNSVWPPLFTESYFDGRVVLGVHILINHSFPATKSQLDRWDFTYWWCHRDNVLYHVLGSLCQPTTSSSNLLRASEIHFIWFILIRHLECSWDNSLCIQGAQSCIRNSG